MLHSIVTICAHLGHLRCLGRYGRLLTRSWLPLTPPTGPDLPCPAPRGFMRHWHRDCVLPGLPANILSGILQTGRKEK